MTIQKGHSSDKLWRQKLKLCCRNILYNSVCDHFLFEWSIISVLVLILHRGLMMRLTCTEHVGSNLFTGLIITCTWYGRYPSSCNHLETGSCYSVPLWCYFLSFFGFFFRCGAIVCSGCMYCAVFHTSNPLILWVDWPKLAEAGHEQEKIYICEFTIEPTSITGKSFSLWAIHYGSMIWPYSLWYLEIKSAMKFKLLNFCLKYV